MEWGAGGAGGGKDGGGADVVSFFFFKCPRRTRARYHTPFRQDGR